MSSYWKGLLTSFIVTTVIITLLGAWTTLHPQYRIYKKARYSYTKNNQSSSKIKRSA